ncbi:aspartyl/asparaginyl beta-hydroxylase isoform X4 [Alligator mississippiensis]|uniref:aspartyl/asparaginyl beta-hydroxylase isoform X4 n=1 Tax=Alligator mississippiensis TaxID=8496 RepID=UPI0028772620|nr:aspartyl/asparaginyl beta-hydroxylase isoform X4 [Alligator mississippiensis]
MRLAEARGAGRGAPRLFPRSGLGAGARLTPRYETKHGGSKNGKKEGLSGSSFFTWFMVIALLGVWTSVAVVWFELIDYEEVLGKLGIYDADGDGDFDVEDAKVLLGLKERSVPAQRTPAETEESIQPSEQSFIKSEHEIGEPKVEEEIQSVLQEEYHSQFGERKEDVDEGVNDQQEDKVEIYEEVFEIPATDDIHGELEDETLEVIETTEPIQEDYQADEPDENQADEPAVQEPETVEIPVSYKHDLVLEKATNEPEVSDDIESFIEENIEYPPEDVIQEDYNEEHEPKHEEETEIQDPGTDDIDTTGVADVEDERALLEPINEATEPGEIPEDVEINEKPLEVKHTEDQVVAEPHETEIPVQAEDYLRDDLVGKREKETEQEQKEKAKKKKPKLLNKFDKTIKAELDAAEKLRKKGKVEEALKAFEALVNKYPQSPRGRYGKAQSEDDLAEKMRSNEILQKAISTYEEVASLPNAPTDLIKLSLKRQADRQQFLGRMRGSLITLQKLVDLFPNDTSLKNDLGVGYLLIGDNSNAKKVYEEVLILAPDDGFAKVHYGFILKAENKIAESIPYLKEGLESGDPGTDDGRFYFHLGDALQRVGNKEAYKWYELGYQRGHFASVWQRSLYNVKGLKAQPWWTAKETGYAELVKSLERNWKLIRDEGLAVMDKRKSLFLPEDENLREKGDWSQFTLWQQGRKNENACKGVPKTCALLEKYPESTGCRRGQIKYSIMHPGTHVWPHTGPTNCRLRMHLGLVIPKEGCKIRCAQENRTWEEGKVLIFDDSFEHEVWQDAEDYRLIFIVDVWHPELTPQQRRTLPAI